LGSVLRAAADTRSDPVDQRDGLLSVVSGVPTENVHIAFGADDDWFVDEFHRVVVDAGYRDNGGPGEREYHPGYYAAFVLDPDGNNVEVVNRGRD
jgi:catechol 2,3-dioxygenase-like lactoylglutathione lyase family enzyme